MVFLSRAEVVVEAVVADSTGTTYTSLPASASLALMYGRTCHLPPWPLLELFVPIEPDYVVASLFIRPPLPVALNLSDFQCTF